MANDSKYFLRFPATDKGAAGLFGDSDYRPSEGWIDVEGFIWDGNGHTVSTTVGRSDHESKGSVYVTIGGQDRVNTALFRFLHDGTQIRYAVLKAERPTAWVQYTVTGVSVARGEHGGGSPVRDAGVYHYAFDYKTKQVAVGGAGGSPAYDKTAH